MIKFYDPSGASHFGQATITRTTSVNGGLSLTGEVFAGDEVLNGLDYGWWLNFDNEKYVITYKKLSDDTNTIVFDAVQQFFWDFAKVALHSQYTGSHEYSFYLNQLFNGSGYTYQNDATVPAFEKENWGYKNKLSLFNDIMDQADVEFEVHNETVHIAKQIGSDLTSFVRKGINLSDLTEEIKISDFATYAKGYGAFKDSDDQSKGRLEVEYRSELANKFGDLEMDPIVDERYTIASNLIAELKKKIDATYTVSMTMNIYDLENAGYPNYESPKVGDWILAIDEALNFKRKIRIIKLEEQFDATGKRIGYTATCGDLSIVDQYTNIQSSLDSKVQRIQESIDSVAASANGKNSNYYGAKEPVKANEGDLWFDQSNSDPDKWSIKQWANGRWEQLTLNPGEVDAKVNVAKQEAEKAVENAESAATKADQLASKYDDTNSLANQALEKAVGAQSDASIAVAQASSAAADSKDAKQIAGAVSQSYKTLTDGSTMTIAELEGGLAVKLTKSDLNGYATETWAQNQISATADGINGTMSSIKSTVDGQTTSINDLKADSSSFKSQFTTVNNTLGKQTTDIGTLQATSKELTSGFNTLTSDNTTNKNDISQLKQTSTELSSTMTTVQTQVQNSAVGTNLLNNTGTDYNPEFWYSSSDTTYSVKDGIVTVSSKGHTVITSRQQGIPLTAGDHVVLSIDVKGTGNIMSGYHNGDNYEADSPVQYVNSPDTWKRISFYRTLISINPQKSQRFTFDPENGSEVQLRRPKLEKGAYATDYSVNPADNATVTALSSISQTIESIQTTVRGKVDQSQITQLSGLIEQKVSSTDFNNLRKNVELQTLYSADINNMKTNGHYFVHNLANTPIVGWIYVDVVGNGNNRIRQDVYHDLNNQHFYRRWTGSSWSAWSQSATESEITQLSDNINLRVEKDGVINAINVSNEGTSIYGSKLHITADTYIDNATIKDAMIESINATKIRTGTLDADKIDVIHLNADNITAGTIRGTNLTISLDSGNIDFQAGRIHSADNSFDINISDKYISVADSDNRVLISGGEIQMVQPKFLSQQQTPYVRISNDGGSSSWGGATFWARDYFVVTNGANDRDPFNLPLGIQRFAGISGGQTANGWKPTTIGGADRGVFISGGQGYTNGLITYSPYITVGDNAHSGSGMNGSNIVMGGDYIYLRSNHTTSSGANAYLAPDGALVRSTSAAKYKTDIVRTFETEMGNKLLEVPVAHWKDKEEVLAKTRDSNAKDPETYFGMIADDLDDAGLNELVEYDDKGRVNGIQYDRVALALIPLIRNYRDRITELETKSNK